MPAQSLGRASVIHLFDGVSAGGKITLRTLVCACILDGAMNGRQFIGKVRRWAKARDLAVHFDATAGPGSHGTLYAGSRKTTVKDRKKEIGKGLLLKMLDDLGIGREEF